MSADVVGEAVTKIGPKDSLPYRQSRFVKEAIFFIDPEFAEKATGFKIRFVWYQGSGSSINVNGRVFMSDGSEAWIASYQDIDGRVVAIDSPGAYLHMVEATPIYEEPESPEPEPELDTEALWKSVEDCQMAVDGALREVYRAYVAANTAKERAQEAINYCDEASTHLAEIRAELEKVK